MSNEPDLIILTIYSLIVIILLIAAIQPKRKIDPMARSLMLIISIFSIVIIISEFYK